MAGAYGRNVSGYGVQGLSTYGTGVYGSTTLGGSAVAGVYGLSSGSNGVGVLGATTNCIGSIGVYRTSSIGYAGFFQCDVAVNGTLSKSAGSFKIDDPLDPADKYLYHSFVESRDMMDIYNGNITTDGNGEATVTMPAWFQELNRDFRYQLTAIGAPSQPVYRPGDTRQHLQNSRCQAEHRGVVAGDGYTA